MPPSDDSPESSSFLERDNSSPHQLIEKYEHDPRRQLRGTSATWGATPPQPRAEQYDVYLRLEKRYNDCAPDYVPPVLKEYINLHFASRFFQRQARNSISYHDRRVQNIDVLPVDVKDVLDRANTVQATPYELLQLRQYLDMPSIELGRSSHAYGEGMKQEDGPNTDLENMRSAVEYAVLANGGHVFNRDEYVTFEIDKGHVRTEESDTITIGFLMKRIIIVGVLPDSTEVIERSSFVLNLDELSKTDTLIVDTIRSINVKEDQDWREKILAIPRFENEVVPELLRTDNFVVAIPLSTTVFALNEARAKEVALEKQTIAREKDEAALRREIEHENQTSGHSYVPKIDPDNPFKGIYFSNSSRKNR